MAKLIFRWFQRVCSGGSAQLSAVFPVDNQAGLFCAAAAAADDEGVAAELAAGFALVAAGAFAGFVAGGGDQRLAEQAAEAACAGVVGDADGEFAAVAAAQQAGDAVGGGQEEGFACRPLAFEQAAVGFVEGLQKGTETVECVADDDHAFVLGAAFEADEFFQCLCVRRQAAEPVAGFGGIGDEAAAFEVVFQTA